MARTKFFEKQIERKVLIIRFSSLGDILQAAAAPFAIKSALPSAEIHWLVRDDFSSLVDCITHVDRVIAFPRGSLLQLFSFAWQLAGSNYTDVYDAHSNLRSHLFVAIFRLRICLQFFLMPRLSFFTLKRRSKNRLRRWLFFRFRLPTLPRPFLGAASFLEPLRDWGIESLALLRSNSQFIKEIDCESPMKLPSTYITIAPSAAWEMKRWPAEKWADLIRLLESQKIVILGGPEDVFCEDLARVAPERVLNLAGKLKLIESLAVLQRSSMLIANDTGLLHAADLMGKPCIAIIGPTAFGYPSRNSSAVAEIHLPCKPCSKDGRGRCSQRIYKKCLVELSVQQVLSQIQKMVLI